MYTLQIYSPTEEPGLAEVQRWIPIAKGFAIYPVNHAKRTPDFPYPEDVRYIVRDGSAEYVITDKDHAYVLNNEGKTIQKIFEPIRLPKLVEPTESTNLVLKGNLVESTEIDKPVNNIKIKGMLDGTPESTLLELQTVSNLDAWIIRDGGRTYMWVATDGLWVIYSTVGAQCIPTIPLSARNKGE